MPYEKLLKDLRGVVGPENVLTDPEILEKYSKDQSFVRSCRPDCIVLPKSVEEIREVVGIANKYLVPIMPYSSGQNLHGATIPYQGGIILNLSKMNKIIEINERNGFAIIEPGVMYVQLQDELEKHGFRVMVPLGVPPTRSVLSSLLERDPLLAAASFEIGNATFMDTEMILPTGELFRTGTWSAEGAPPGGPEGPIQWLPYRFWTGGQGTLGILTKMVVNIEHLSEVCKVFFIPFDRIEDAIEPIRRIQRRELGIECFALNDFNLAAILTPDWTIPDSFPCENIISAEFEALRERLPKWTIMIALWGLPYFPEDKVAYEEADLKDVCSEANVEPMTTVAGIAGLDNTIVKELLRPWGILKKFRYKGSVHDVNFYSPLNKIPRFEGIIRKLADKYGYSTKDIGGYVLPIERGRATYCEFDFHCNLDNPEETEKVKRLWFEANEALLDNGAFLAKLYGPVTEIIYRRTIPTYTEKLRELKRELDPNNILNPGKLCF